MSNTAHASAPLAAVNTPAPGAWVLPLEPRALAQQVEALPPLPEALAEVLRVMRHEALSANHCIELIERDQALAARTLRLANSAFYGMPGRVGSIGDAVRLLGLRTVSGVLTAATLHQAIQVPDCPPFKLATHWQHALATALAARALAPLAAQDPDLAFLAGLMHDMGRLVLAALCPQQAGQALALHASAPPDMLLAERQMLGLDHAQIGALLAQRWQFPAELVAAVASHHDDGLLAPGASIGLPAVVHAANALARLLTEPNAQAEHGSPAPALPAALLLLSHRLGQSPDEALRLVLDVQRLTRELSDQLLGPTGLG